MATTDDTLLVNRMHMPHELDGGVAERAAIGLIVLATDHTIEHEWRQVFHGLDGVAFFESRIMNSADINPETLAAMEADLTSCTAVIRPGERLDVVAYGCTSGGMVIGPPRVAERIHAARPESKATTPILAVLEGLRAMDVKRVALLTPYIDEVNQWMRRYVEEAGIAVPVMGSFNNGNDNDVARISQASLEDAIVELGAHEAVDGVFVACTSLRVCGIVERAEARLGKPVTSSNHALAWHSLRLAGVDDRLDGLGRLFRI